MPKILILSGTYEDLPTSPKDMQRRINIVLFYPYCATATIDAVFWWAWKVPHGIYRKAKKVAPNVIYCFS